MTPIAFQQSAAPGFLISFDGTDSSGKATQARLLAEHLRYQGRTVREFATPDYNTASGRELKLRLQNKMGDWVVWPWENKMLLFARNRLEHRAEVLAGIKQGEVVIYDRYVPSSLAFMTIEASAPQDVDKVREVVQRRVAELEYGENDMPREDLSIFLDVPAEVSDQLLAGRKAKRQDEAEYTDHLHVQQRLYNEYDILCRKDPMQYARVMCLNGSQLLGKEEISELVWETVHQRLFTHND